MAELLSPKELAQKLGISLRTLRRWRSMGFLPEPIKLSARVVRWEWENIRLWLQKFQERKPRRKAQSRA